MKSRSLSSSLRSLGVMTRGAALVMTGGALVAAPLKAQMPGTPVLQNAWASPGIVIAADLGGGSGSAGGSTFAGAVAWTPGNGRFQVSGGAGVASAKGGGSRGVYGGRVAVPLMQMMSGKLGIAGFAGIGGGSGKAGATTLANTVVPAGIAVGYRQSNGTSGRGFSVYADPNYQYHSGSGGSNGYFRFGIGLDAGITSRFGATLGIESGTAAKAGTVGPAGSTYGIGLSMKLGR
jgi:hypothetical protein